MMPSFFGSTSSSLRACASRPASLRSTTACASLSPPLPHLSARPRAHHFGGCSLVTPSGVICGDPMHRFSMHRSAPTSAGAHGPLRARLRLQVRSNALLPPKAAPSSSLPKLRPPSGHVPSGGLEDAWTRPRSSLPARSARVQAAGSSEGRRPRRAGAATPSDGQRHRGAITAAGQQWRWEALLAYAVRRISGRRSRRGRRAAARPARRRLEREKRMGGSGVRVGVGTE